MTTRRVDITGERCGKLVALHPTGAVTKSRNAVWECRCDCGELASVNTGQWAARSRVSCGCSLRTQFACRVSECNSPAHARNLCYRHYRWFRATGSTEASPTGTSWDPIERFRLKTRRVENGCLEWTGTIGRAGYGQTSVRGIKKNTHRLAWELFIGPIPNGLFVCHRCDNRKCVDINHLFLGTQRDNIQDAMRKGRMKFPWERT